MMKKIIAIATIFTLFVAFCPKQVTNNSKEIQVYSVYMNGQCVTVDAKMSESLADMISRIYSHRVIRTTFITSGTNALEINYLYAGKPYVIVFGENDYCYMKSGVFTTFSVINANIVQSQIEEVLIN